MLSIFLSNVSVFGFVSILGSAAFAQSPEGIKIYSPNANPNNPIMISNSAGQAPVVTPPQSSLPRSELDQVPPMSEEEAKAMLEIMSTVSRANQEESIIDDPLAGLSPEQRAFIEAMQAVVPMSPEQIEMFKKRYYDAQIATNKGVVADPAPVSRSIDLSLVPGEDLPVVRMSPGNVATLTFSDKNGNPWPILSVTTGDSSSFGAQTAGEQGNTNILVVNPLKNWAYSNMVVTLVDYPVPILMTLDSRQNSVVDFRLDVRIGETGPNTDMRIVENFSLPPTGDSTMISFLDGVPPMGAEKMRSSHKGVEVWTYNDNMYVRTKTSMMSPAYFGKTSNVSGVNVFVLQESPVLLVSDNGNLVSVTVNK